MRTLLSRLPLSRALRSYSKAAFKDDLSAGLTTAILLDADDGDNDGVYARVESDLIGGERAFTVGGTVHWSWTRFNLELGVEYGAYSVPFINFIVPSRSFAPRFDLYWRF